MNFWSLYRPKKTCIPSFKVNGQKSYYVGSRSTRCFFRKLQIDTLTLKVRKFQTSGTRIWPWRFSSMNAKGFTGRFFHKFQLGSMTLRVGIVELSDVRKSNKMITVFFRHQLLNTLCLLYALVFTEDIFHSHIRVLDIWKPWYAEFQGQWINLQFSKNQRADLNSTFLCSWRQQKLYTQFKGKRTDWKIISFLGGNGLKVEGMDFFDFRFVANIFVLINFKHGLWNCDQIVKLTK